MSNLKPDLRRVRTKDCQNYYYFHHVVAFGDLLMVICEDDNGFLHSLPMSAIQFIS